MYGCKYGFILMRSSYCENLRMCFADQRRLGAKATRNDYLSVLRQRLSDRVKGFFTGAIEESAGVNDDQVSSIIVGSGLIAFRSELAQNSFGVD